MSEPIQKSRSGSQRRQASEQIKINCTPAERAQILALAASHGQSPAALCKNTLLKIPLPPASRKINDRLIAKFLAASATLADPLRQIRVQLDNIGDNFNQLVRYAHMDRLMAASIIAAQKDIADIIPRLLEAIGDLHELRTAGMQAVGAERLPRDEKEP